MEFNGALTDTDDMDEHTTPLTLSEAKHLLRRTSFGAKPREAEALVGRTARSAVDALLTASRTVPLPNAPSWINDLLPGRTASDDVKIVFDFNNTAWRVELTEDWIGQMAVNRMRERITLFWHDHFVTSYKDYTYSAWAYRYLNTLRTNAFGNFKSFVHAIGLDPAMLVYLDGNINNGNAPNENYARELLELFTMGPLDKNGVANYTEMDIQEMAKALSGWVLQPTTSWNARFSGPAWDDGSKTFLGRTGEFGYDDVVNILFETRAVQIAHFMANKLVQEFVYRVPDIGLVERVANTLLTSNFNLLPAYQVLFTDKAFFNSAEMGGREKSPIELCVGHLVEMGVVPVTTQTNYIRRAIVSIEQNLLDPPNVAGWPGHREWITTSTLAARWSISDQIVRRYLTPQQVLAFAEAKTPPGSNYAAIDLAIGIANQMFAVPLSWVEVAKIEEPFEGDLLTNPLPEWFLNGPEHERNLVKIFLNGLPWYEWNLSIGGASDRIVAYVIRLAQFPEYQLM